MMLMLEDVQGRCPSPHGPRALVALFLMTSKVLFNQASKEPEGRKEGTRKEGERDRESAPRDGKLKVWLVGF